MKTQQIEVKNIKVDDRIITEEGSVVTITKISKGIPRGTIQLDWKGGWAALFPNNIIERMV